MTSPPPSNPVLAAVLALFGRERVEGAFTRANTAAAATSATLARLHEFADASNDEVGMRTFVLGLPQAEGDGVILAMLGDLAPSPLPPPAAPRPPQRITLTLDGALLDALDTQAQRLGISRAAAIRLSLHEGLGSLEAIR